MQIYTLFSILATLFSKKCIISYTFSANSLYRKAKTRTFAYKKHAKLRTMGLGTYWARKDDQTDELKTVKPWEEEVSNGDKYFPDPHQEKQDTKEDGPSAK